MAIIAKGKVYATISPVEELNKLIQKNAEDILKKQDILQAGENIIIDNDIISAKDTIYDDTELRRLITEIPKFDIVVVDELPSVGEKDIIYLLRDPDAIDGENNLYTEYIYINGTYETLGSQKIDLSEYAKTIILTYDEYNQLTESEKNNGTQYYIVDDEEDEDLHERITKEITYSDYIKLSDKDKKNGIIYLIVDDPIDYSSEGGGSANVVEIKYSDYEKLSKEEQENGTMYLTEDDPADGTGGGSGGACISYSTEEQDTGLTWIDGKRIYQKSYECDFGVSQTWGDTGIHKEEGVIAVIKAYGVDSNGSFINMTGLSIDHDTYYFAPTPVNVTVKKLTIQYIKEA